MFPLFNNIKTLAKLLYIFSDEQGIRIPDDDDGGFNDEKPKYKPVFPPIANQFNNGGFSGPTSYSKPNPQPRPENDYPKLNAPNNIVYQTPQPPVYQTPQPPKPTNYAYQPKPPASNTYGYQNGPTFSTQGYPSSNNRRNTKRTQKKKIPLTIGLDVYPVLGNQGKHNGPSHYGSSRETGSPTDENLHEVLLKLNLFSRKPQERGGNRRGDIEQKNSISLGPFSYNMNGYDYV